MARKPGHPEVDQANAALGIDQQVGRLDVAVHDQPGVRMRDRFAGLHDQRHRITRPKAALRAPVMDRHAIHILHHHVRRAVVQQPAVDHPGDPGMLEHGEDAAFVVELLPVTTDCMRDALQRGVLQVLAIGALHFVHLAHAATPQQPYHPPCPDPVAGIHACRP